MDNVRTIAFVAILALGVFVALSPKVVYAPQPRVVLFLLMSVLVALLFGETATAVTHLQLDLPGFALLSTGATAICFGLLWLLNYLAKPEEKIAVFYIEQEDGKPVNLQPKGAVEVPVTPKGLMVTHAVSGNNALILIFPEQVGEAQIRVRSHPNGDQFIGVVAYAGNRSSRLRLNHELKQLSTS